VEFVTERKAYAEYVLTIGQQADIAPPMVYNRRKCTCKKAAHMRHTGYCLKEHTMKEEEERGEIRKRECTTRSLGSQGLRMVSLAIPSWKALPEPP